VKRIQFSFELDARYIRHLKEKSCYNHNYYELDLSHYGDYIIPQKCNILYEDAEDDCYATYYSIGYFDEDGEFQAMWTWLEDTYKDFKTQEVT